MLDSTRALVPRIKNDNYDQKFALQRDMTVADVNDLINADYVRFQRRDARIFFFCELKRNHGGFAPLSIFPTFSRVYFQIKIFMNLYTCR